MTNTARPQRFQDTSVLVTGGSSGIGADVVRALAAEGAQVMFCGLPDGCGEQLEHTLCAQGHKARFVAADVRADDQMRQLVASCLQSLGGLDMAVNCAGISHPPQRLADIDPDHWRNVMATNADGIFYAMRHEIPAMLENGDPDRNRAIVNIASILGTRGAPWIAAYGASKHAVVGLTQSAARDYATFGLRINAVSPGPVDTPMLARALRDIGSDTSKYAGGFPPAGPGKPHDVAAAVLFLLSLEAAYINGTNLHVDGATTAI
ncbi:SDR family NAD(P)-dependent oxidoreductase [Iodidimonas muriae]|nr:SDR family oxidoreductase [Iodidimonas muriae]